MGSCSLDFWLGLVHGVSYQEIRGRKENEISMLLSLMMSHMVATPWLGMMGSDQSLGLGGHHFGVLQYFSGEGRNLRLV